MLSAFFLYRRTTNLTLSGLAPGALLGFGGSSAMEGSERCFRYGSYYEGRFRDCTSTLGTFQHTEDKKEKGRESERGQGQELLLAAPHSSFFQPRLT